MGRAITLRRFSLAGGLDSAGREPECETRTLVQVMWGGVLDRAEGGLHWGKPGERLPVGWRRDGWAVRFMVPQTSSA